MKSLAPYSFIHLGLCIRFLRHCNGFNINIIIEEANKLIDNLKYLDFAVSKIGAIDLSKFIDELKKDGNIEKIISATEFKNINEIMQILEKIIYAEAHTKTIYVITEGRFGINNLIISPDKMFAKSIYRKLSDMAQYDIKEGFLCLSFSRPTASAFHILRGTESVLKEYYLLKVKRGRDKNPMWGPMVRSLSARKDKNVKLLLRLDYIRDSYRNPTAHPDAVYSLEQSEDLIGLCIDVINDMASEFEDIPF